MGLQESLRQLRNGLSPRRLLGLSDRPFTIFDITEYFGETSGGVRTYLREKSAYVERHPALAQVVVVPGARDAVSVNAPRMIEKPKS